MSKGFRLFLLENADRGGRPADSEQLVRKAALLYGVPDRELAQAAWLRTAAGKPYFADAAVHFSISHTEGLWACLMGPAVCGLDIQQIRPCNYEKIAGRFFSPRESEYVRAGGLRAFFALWTAREAVGKYTGGGFFSALPELVREDGRPAARIILDGDEELALRQLQLKGAGGAGARGEQKADVFCAVCLPAAKAKEVIDEVYLSL